MKQSFNASIRPGRKKGDPVVTNICALHYDPNGTISYKLHFSDAWENLPHRQRLPVCNKELSRLYEGPCSIDSIKFTHLQELKDLLPADCRLFYANLLHK